MKKMILPALGLSAAVLGGCSESIYVSAACSPDTLNTCTDKNGHALSADDLEFIAPYYGGVENTINVGISQSASSPSKSNPNNPPVGGAGSDQSGQGNSASGAPTLSMTVIPTPKQRFYLYMKKNSLYSDSVNVTVGKDGLLSGSDTASTQQLSAVVMEIVQTAESIATAAGSHALKGKTSPPPTTNPAECISALKSWSPIYQNASYPPSGSETLATVPWAPPHGVSHDYVFTLKTSLPARTTFDAKELPANITDSTSFDGIVAFEPVPMTVKLVCQREGFGETQLSPTQVVDVYADRQLLEPSRGFFSSPQDTYTFNEGFITGHKYSDQSTLKGFFDVLFTPVHALLPSSGAPQGNSGTSGNSGSTGGP